MNFYSLIKGQEILRCICFKGNEEILIKEKAGAHIAILSGHLHKIAEGEKNYRTHSILIYHHRLQQF